MADKTEATTTPAAETASGDDVWDSPAAHGIEHEPPVAVSSAEPDTSVSGGEVDASTSADTSGELAALVEQVKELREQVLAKQPKVEPAKRPPLTLDLPEELQLDPTLTKQLQGLVKQLNDRDTERETEHRTAMEKLGGLESDNKLSKQARANFKMLDALPNDHFRAVFEGDEANDNSEQAAVKMEMLRSAYKAAGGKVPSERALFTEASLMLFFNKAEELRQKGGRPKKDRTINRVSPAANGKPQFGRTAALMAWNQKARANNWAVPMATENDFQDNDKGY